MYVPGCLLELADGALGFEKIHQEKKGWNKTCAQHGEPNRSGAPGFQYFGTRCNHKAHTVWVVRSINSCSRSAWRGCSKYTSMPFCSSMRLMAAVSASLVNGTSTWPFE